MKAPLIVNYGGGVDSTAMLIGLHDRGERPDLVIFADTGGEKPDTYEQIDRMDAKLTEWGWPTIVRVKNAAPRSDYKTLEENCRNNETLPSLAFGFKSCSLKWKAAPMDKWILGGGRGADKQPGWAPALAALDVGVKPVKCIGYDNGPSDSRRAVGKTEDDNFIYRYPLREWGWDRATCIERIAREGMSVPVKSACFFCPASKPWELLILAARWPELFLRAIAMEDGARAGKHGLKTVAGLWRKQSWRNWAEQAGILSGNTIVMPREQLERLAATAKPQNETACGDGMLDRGRPYDV